MQEVVFVTRILTHYRVPFHQSVYTTLRKSGISYRLLYSPPRPQEAKKGDLATIPWAEKIPIHHLGKSNLCWQHIFGSIKSADLVVIGQENSNLSNYALQTNRHFNQKQKVAFFGHGKNFQAKNPNSPSECFKRFWLTRVDWWFAYTDFSADIIERVGFPRKQITVLNNSIDTSKMREEVKKIDSRKLETLRKTQFQNSSNIGVFIGGMYPLKRLSFLIESAEYVRKKVANFQLLLIGDGDEAIIAQQAAAKHDWVHYVGPKFGKEKAELITLSNVLLMPGLVGLGVLDSFVYGTPMVTTNVPYHSPEINYLEDGVNGVVVKSTENPIMYADAVIRVLSESSYRAKLQAGTKNALDTYTIEAMAARFTQGVIQAITT